MTLGALKGRFENDLPARIIILAVVIYAFVGETLVSGDYRLAWAYPRLPNPNLSGTAGNWFNQIFWIAILLLAMVELWRRGRSLGRFSWPLLLLCLYLGLGLATVAWSPVPGVGLRRCVLQIIVSFSVIVAARAHDTQVRLLRTVAIGLSAVILFNLAWQMLNGTYAHGGATGAYPHKNLLGQVAAASVVIILFGAWTSRGWARGAFAFSAVAALYLCWISNSKTSFGLLLVAPLLAVILLKIAHLPQARKRLAVVAAVWIALLLAFAAGVARVGVDDISMALFGDPTFTGRTLIWAWLWKYVEQAPLLGHGFASFWSIGADSVPVREGPPFIQIINSAHSGYLDVLIDTGGVGLAIVLLFCAAVAVSLLRGTHRGPATFALLASLLFVLLHNAMETTLLAGFASLWILMLIIAAAANTKEECTKY